MDRFTHVLVNIACWMVIYAAWRVCKHIEYREDQDAKRAKLSRGWDDEDLFRHEDAENE